MRWQDTVALLTLGAVAGIAIAPLVWWLASKRIATSTLLTRWGGSLRRMTRPLPIAPHAEAALMQQNAQNRDECGHEWVDTHLHECSREADHEANGATSTHMCRCGKAQWPHS